MNHLAHADNPQAVINPTSTVKDPTPPTILRQRVSALLTGASSAQAGDTVIIAVSGGPDSVALLHILGTALPRIQFIAAYIDHGLRPDETGAESELIQSLAQRLHAGFERIAVNVRETARLMKTSIEETARNLRYQALETIRQQYQAKAIAVAHTADDQAEELLIRLIRGCGRKGLSGMQIKNGWIIRPLLDEKKETLLHYLQWQQIPFCVDSSNLERNYLRNRVRLDLLPYLQDHFNRSIRQTLLQTAHILRDEEALLEEMTDEAWQKTARIVAPQPASSETPPSAILIATRQFCLLPMAIQRRILEKCCRQMAARPQFRQIELLLDLFHTGNTGAEIHLSRGLRAYKTKDAVSFSYPVGKRSYRGKMPANTTPGTDFNTT